MTRTDIHWQRFAELNALDSDDPAWEDGYQALRAELERSIRESSCAELLFLDAYSNYMLAPRRDAVTSSIDARRVEGLLGAVLVLEPAHAGAAMTLAYLRYDQSRYEESLALFRGVDAEHLRGEHVARRLEMISACLIRQNDIASAGEVLVQLADEWRRLPPYGYEPLQLSFLVSSLVDSDQAHRLGPLQQALLALDAIGRFSWFAEDLRRATESAR